MQTHQRITLVSSAAVLALPVANLTAQATAATSVAPKKTSVWKKVSGSAGQAGRWGNVQVTLVVRKTTTTTVVNGTSHKKLARRITGVSVPVYPDHTGRSVFINQQALPVLIQEVLQAQLNPNIDLVSGATDTSQAFLQSLQSAILQAKKV